MASKINKDKEDDKVFENIKECINNNKSFVLNGGAGSGKTYTLTKTLEYIFTENIKYKVACITYTNAAKNEINERFNRYGEIASTIHAFLWDQIKGFQYNIKESLIYLLNTEDKDKNKKIISFKLDEGETIEQLCEEIKNKKIEYKEYKSIRDGIISHDEVIKIAYYMFEKYDLLSKIVSDKFDFILIDEYQDTFEKVIDICLDFIPNKNTGNKKIVVGLFGDSMQSIYSNGIGDVEKYTKDNTIVNIQKEDNYRCSKSVIKLINKLRLDDLKQKPANNNLEGKITFLYAKSDAQVPLDKLKQHKVFENWDFNNKDKTKILFLTHKLIANNFGFINLFNAYNKVYKDNSLGNNKDFIAKYIIRLQNIISLYNEKKYNDFIRETSYKISNIDDKKTLKCTIDDLNKLNTIAELIDYSKKNNIIQKDDNFEEYIKKDEKRINLYNEISKIDKKELERFYEYDKKESVFATQHSIKGAEFDNVFIILDAGKFPGYNFNSLFENTGKDTTIARTTKIFYVTCSRSKDNLVVYFENPSDATIEMAKNLFGENNVIKFGE